MAADKKLYRIRQHFVIHVNEKTVYKGGDVCELDEHTAMRNFHKLEELSQKQAADYRKAQDAKPE